MIKQHYHYHGGGEKMQILLARVDDAERASDEFADRLLRKTGYRACRHFETNELILERTPEARGKVPSWLKPYKRENCGDDGSLTSDPYLYVPDVSTGKGRRVAKDLAEYFRTPGDLGELRCSLIGLDRAWEDDSIDDIQFVWATGEVFIAATRDLTGLVPDWIRPVPVEEYTRLLYRDWMDNFHHHGDGPEAAALAQEARRMRLERRAKEQLYVNSIGGLRLLNQLGACAFASVDDAPSWMIQYGTYHDDETDTLLHLFKPDPDTRKGSEVIDMFRNDPALTSNEYEYLEDALDLCVYAEVHYAMGELFVYVAPHPSVPDWLRQIDPTVWEERLNDLTEDELNIG